MRGLPLKTLTYKTLIWAYSSAGLERTPDKREVDGSSPFRPIYGELAQLGEHLLCKQEVIGSIPLFSIVNHKVDRVCTLKTKYYLISLLTKQ